MCVCTRRACINKTLVASCPKQWYVKWCFHQAPNLSLAKQRALKWTRNTTKCRPCPVVRRQRDNSMRADCALSGRGMEMLIILKSSSETTRDSGRHTKREAKERTSSYATIKHHAAVHRQPQRTCAACSSSSLAASLACSSSFARSNRPSLSFTYSIPTKHSHKNKRFGTKRSAIRTPAPGTEVRGKPPSKGTKPRPLSRLPHKHSAGPRED